MSLAPDTIAQAAPALIVIFILAYTAIALEHPIKINKSGSALVGAGLLWTIYALSVGLGGLLSRGRGLPGAIPVVPLKPTAI